MPWKKKDNPFYSNDWGNRQDSSSSGKSDKPVYKRHFPLTHVEVPCTTCAGKGKQSLINIRVENDDSKDNGETGFVSKKCWTCSSQVIVKVYRSGAVDVTLEKRNVPYELVWQEPK